VTTPGGTNVTRSALSVGSAALAAFFVLAVASASATNTLPSTLYAVATGQLSPATVTINGITRVLPFPSGGLITSEQEALGLVKPATAKNSPGGPSAGSSTGSSTGDELGIAPSSWGCGKRDLNPQTQTLNGNSGDQRVNQDCSFRRQAEEDIIFNPGDVNNLLAGQNDNRAGYNQCGIAFSLDNGNRWGDVSPPSAQRENAPERMHPGTSNNSARNMITDDPNDNTITGLPGTHKTYDAAADPSPAFDSQGNGYFSCVLFDIRDNASALYVTQSPAGAKGSFFFNVPTNVDTSGGGPAGAHGFMPVEDNDPTILHDKEFIVADTYPTSERRDSVYVTWTVFRLVAGVYQESPIYGSMSTDHAKTWSTPERISGSSTQLCNGPRPVGTVGLANSECNFDQGSDPIVLPNGDLVVVFLNTNSSQFATNQVLAVRCSPTGRSESGTAHLNCNQIPSLVGQADTSGAPQCDFGRGAEDCIPGAFIRTDDFPRIAINTQSGNVYTVWQDYRRRDNQMNEWSIQISESTDGGLTWTGATKPFGLTVNPDTGLDHYEPAVDSAEVTNVDQVGVSYYRTQRVPSENTGCTRTAPCTTSVPGVGQGDSDYVLAGGTNLQLPYTYKVVSVVFPPPDGVQAGFNGDYSGLTINKGTDAHPIWSDTRNPDPFAPQNGVMHDEDVFSVKVGLPSGNAAVGPGTIGK
jgi:hypothetical protein